jgi:pyruvate dehydrogenase E1 component alpha subunit
MTNIKNEIINFELEIKKLYEVGKIKAPIHLSANNEDVLIKIFKKINKKDWVFSTWRSHYHALLHGITTAWLRNKIIKGRSISIINLQKKFFSSAIVGGSLPISMGVALGLKLKKKKQKVWAFVGDMTFETGTFHETYKYSKNHKLPIKFIVEDNNMSTNTPTNKVWIKKSKTPKDIIYYKYKRKFPHHGTGKWVLF